jgi:Putative adhesin
MASWDFACSEPIDANVSIASGTVSVTAKPTDAITVQIHKGGRAGGSSRDDDDQLTDDVSVDYSDQHLVISELPKRGLGWRNSSLHIAITLPAGSRMAVQAASADVTCRGEYGAVDLRTASGKIDVETVRGLAEISAMSGSVELLEAAEPTIQTASGRISVRRASGDVMARTASGDIMIGTAGASVTAKTASGQVRVQSIARGRSDLNSVSGDIEVKVVPGTGVYLDLASVTGRVTSDLDDGGQQGGAELHLQARTVSGSLHVARAASAEMAG